MSISTSETDRQRRAVSGWDKPELDLTGAGWESGSAGSGDVQIAFVEGFIALRNSTRPDSPSLIFAPDEWRAFIRRARGGAFDLT
ncbi:DUF397 domain-containing protein [Streptomyces sp. BI20]|uniref:DUF397 domain-containing protein n=1 Tax=Streptomyces sp. BI20 TaxID=3403460 RepID=UPI003C746DAC